MVIVTVIVLLGKLYMMDKCHICIMWQWKKRLKILKYILIMKDMKMQMLMNDFKCVI